MSNTELKDACQSLAAKFGTSVSEHVGQTILTVPSEHLLEVCQRLKTDPAFSFEQMMDLTVVDYLHYGQDEWTTDDATATGFERGVSPIEGQVPTEFPSRFCVVYHLLSVTKNQRLILKTFVPDETHRVDSVIEIWNCANWYEREAFDLFGVLFNNHPDLRRLLTDYGFMGHPFRKDFPLWGEVEVRYDHKQGRVVYEPVDIVPRVLVPKVIRMEEQSYINLSRGKEPEDQ